VILDAVNTADFETSEAELEEKGVLVTTIDHAPSIELNRRFQQEPATRSLWLGDVGG
jgi:hypothetical protein